MLPGRSILAVSLSLLLVVASVPGGGVAAPSNGTSGTGPAAAQEVSGSLSQSTYTVVRGDEVEISFSHSGPATLYVGGEDAGYRLKVEVGGSGSSTVTIDTYASMNADPSTYVDGGSAEVLYPRGGLSQSLVAAPYNLNLTVGNVTQDLGLLLIEPRPEANLTTRTVPKRTDFTEVDHGGVLGTSTTTDTIARGDYAVFEINGTGLQEAINPDDLTGDANANGIKLFLEDLDPPPNKASDSFAVDTNDPAVETVWNEDTANLLVAWDTSDVDLSQGSHSYNVTLRIESEHNNLLTADSLEAQANITVVKPKIDLQTGDGQLEVYPWESDVVNITGRTNYAPQSTFEFRARAFEPRPFLMKSPATVSENGTFSTEIDFGDVARGVEPSLWVLGYRDLTEWDVELRESNASFEFANQTAENGSVVRVRNVSLSVGGFVVVERANGSRLGASAPIAESDRQVANVTLEPSLNRSSYVTVTAVMDWNQNGSYDPDVDKPYAVNGTNVSETAVVFVPETGLPDPPAETNLTTSSSANNSTLTTTTNNSTTTSTVTTLSVQSQDPLTPGTSGGNAPTPLALPVLSILAAGLLWRRFAD